LQERHPRGRIPTPLVGMARSGEWAGWLTGCADASCFCGCFAAQSRPQQPLAAAPPATKALGAGWGSSGGGGGEARDASLGSLSRASTMVRSASLASFASLPPAAPRFADLLSTLDVVQLLGWSSLVDLAALRVTAASAEDDRLHGFLGVEDKRRLVGEFLRHCRGSTGVNIHEAADWGNIEAVWGHLYLGTAPDHYDEHGCVAMHYAATGKRTGIFRMLLRVGADKQARFTGLNIRAGWTPLHFAAHAGARDIVLLLLLARAEVNQMDSCRRTALFYAQSRNRDSCSSLLVKFGGSADSHLVEASNLREAMRLDEDNVLAPRSRGAHEWDASGADDAALQAQDGMALAAAAAGIELQTDREAESAPRPLRPYVGPAGDIGIHLTIAAAVMPGFEW